MSDLTQIDKGPLAAFPDYMKEVSGREGLENVKREDLVLPRLNICQSMTPQRKPQNSNFIKGLEEGQFFNTVTSENYGSTVELIPLVFSPSRIYFRDLDEGGGILCQSFDSITPVEKIYAEACAVCPHSRWTGEGEERRAPLCTEFANYPALVLTEGGGTSMLVASFKNTALKPARAWLTRMNMLTNPVTKKPMPLFSAVYEVRTNAEKNANGQDYFAPVFKFKRWPSQVELEMAKREYEALKGLKIATDEVKNEEVHDEHIPF